MADKAVLNELQAYFPVDQFTIFRECLESTYEADFLSCFDQLAESIKAVNEKNGTDFSNDSEVASLHYFDDEKEIFIIGKLNTDEYSAWVMRHGLSEGFEVVSLYEIVNSKTLELNIWFTPMSVSNAAKDFSNTELFDKEVSF